MFTAIFLPTFHYFSQLWFQNLRLLGFGRSAVAHTLKKNLNMGGYPHPLKEKAWREKNENCHQL